jgi:hypothetical protein
MKDFRERKDPLFRPRLAHLSSRRRAFSGKPLHDLGIGRCENLKSADEGRGKATRVSTGADAQAFAREANIKMMGPK